MRGPGVVAVALLLAASGCAGTLPAAEDDQATATVTPAPVPGTPSESPSWIVDGEVDADALVATHERRLGDRSYRTAVRWNRTRALPNGIQRTTIRNRVAVAGRGVYAVNVTATVRLGDSRSRVPPRSVVGITVGPGDDAYADGSVAYARTADAEDRYERRAPNLSRYESDVSRVLNWALDVDETRVRPVERDGETWYRVTGRERPEHWGVDDFEMRALVSPEGLVHRATVRYLDEDETVSVEVRYADLGNASVTEPGWVQAARNATG